jgi:LacI family transcriptional regulator
MSRLQGRRSSESPTLAYLNPTRVSPHRDNFRTFARYWEGACRRCDELGYRLEEFPLLEPGLPPDRLSKLLFSRGIMGVIIASPDPEVKEVRLAWEHFAVVSIDHVLEYPDVHWASANHFQHMWLTMETLERLGYERVGLCMSRGADRRVYHAWVSAFLGYRQWMTRRRQQVPPYLVQHWETLEGGAFAAWLARHRPDVIVCPQTGIVSRLAEAGYRVPQDIALVHLARDTAEVPCAGIDQNSELVGAAAVELVVGQLHRNERGLPAFAKCVMIEGRWVDGPTLVASRLTPAAAR